jgi:hypothetical protein
VCVCTVVVVVVIGGGGGGGGGGDWWWCVRVCVCVCARACVVDDQTCAQHSGMLVQTLTFACTARRTSSLLIFTSSPSLERCSA